MKKIRKFNINQIGRWYREHIEELCSGLRITFIELVVLICSPAALVYGIYEYLFKKSDYLATYEVVSEDKKGDNT